MGLLATETASGSSKIVTAEMLNGVLTEITSLLPVCIPVMVGSIAIRKGIGFVRDILHSA